MKTLDKFLFIASFLACACAAHAETGDGVLWWCVNSDAKVGGKTLEAAGVESARIHVTGDGIGEDVFLNLYVDSGSGYQVYDGAYYADVPVSEPYYAALGSYGSPEYSFSIELGAWVDDTFNVLGFSETWSYADIGNYVSNYETMFAPGGMPTAVLAPVSYAAPEPTSGLLVLVGAALMALRRRRIS